MDEEEQGKAWAKRLAASELSELDWVQGLWKRWIEPTEENRGMVFAMGMLLEGQTADWHQHVEPEVFFVLEGEGEARWKAGEKIHTAELKPGVAFYKVGGVPHLMRQSGKRPLRGVVFKIAPVGTANSRKGDR
jgi:quercetin dioxygenase-like cupin family protein